MLSAVHFDARRLTSDLVRHCQLFSGECMGVRVYSLVLLLEELLNNFAPDFERWCDKTTLRRPQLRREDEIPWDLVPFEVGVPASLKNSGE